MTATTTITIVLVVASAGCLTDIMQLPQDPQDDNMARSSEHRAEWHSTTYYNATACTGTSPSPAPPGAACLGPFTEHRGSVTIPQAHGNATFTAEWAPTAPTAPARWILHLTLENGGTWLLEEGATSPYASPTPDLIPGTYSLSIHPADPSAAFQQAITWKIAGEPVGSD